MEGIRVPELIKQMYNGDPIMGNAATQTLETIKYIQDNLTDGQRSDLQQG